MESFIYSNKKVLSPKLCKSFIKLFEAANGKTKGGFIGNDENLIIDKSIKESIDYNFTKRPYDEKGRPVYQHPSWIVSRNKVYVSLKAILLEEKEKYIKKYYGCASLNPLKLDDINAQKYEPNGGFKVWHCERGNIINSNRVLAWMIYLNDVTDKGETEFYHQKHKEKAEEGKILIWPSEWMHIHRGIPSPTQTKYILTGWFSFKNKN